MFKYQIKMTKMQPLTETKTLLENQINNILELEDKEFITQVDNIHKTLALIDHISDPLMISIDDDYANDFVTYFLILYCNNGNLEKSLQIYDVIKSLIRYIALLDRYYDMKDYDCKIRADLLFKYIMNNTNGHLRNAIKHSMDSLWTIAEFEEKLKEKMLNGKELFVKNEIRYHIMKKSSDTILYSAVLENYIERFNPNVSQLLHYNRALLDMQDDFKDIEEDLTNRDLNIFLMSSIGIMSISDVLNGHINTNDVRRKSSGIILSIIMDFETCIHGITVPKEFSFIKKLSKHYIKTLRNSINSL